MEAFKDLKAKSLNGPEKGEELTKEAGSRGEAAIAEVTVGAAGATERAETTSAVQQQATLQRAQIPQPPRERTPPDEPKLVPLGVKFDWDPQQLGFFLVHVLTYMQVYEKSLPNDNAKIQVVILALEGTGGWSTCTTTMLPNFKTLTVS